MLGALLALECMLNQNILLDLTTTRHQNAATVIFMKYHEANLDSIYSRLFGVVLLTSCLPISGNDDSYTQHWFMSPSSSPIKAKDHHTVVVVDFMGEYSLLQIVVY